MKKTVLVFVKNFDPLGKSTGPARSLLNLAESYKDLLELKVVSTGEITKVVNDGRATSCWEDVANLKVMRLKKFTWVRRKPGVTTEKLGLWFYPVIMTFINPFLKTM